MERVGFRHTYLVTVVVAAPAVPVDPAATASATPPCGFATLDANVVVRILARAAVPPCRVGRAVAEGGHGDDQGGEGED